jgi:GAF domain-containing protein
MALPLRSRGQVIGAVTVQSVEEAAFDQAEIAVMQTMADQVAVAIDNAHLFAQAQEALAEMEDIHQRYLRQAWAAYRASRTISGYRQTDAGTKPLAEEVLPEVQQVVTRRSPVVRSGDGGQTPSALIVPVMLAGQPIGALGIQAEEGKRQWSAEEVALAEAISEQFALAAENLRLVDETQRRAVRERLTGEITARMRETLDIETVLNRAANEIGQRLGLAALDLRLGVEGEDFDSA